MQLRGNSPLLGLDTRCVCSTSPKLKLAPSPNRFRLRILPPPPSMVNLRRPPRLCQLSHLRSRPGSRFRVLGKRRGRFPDPRRRTRPRQSPPFLCVLSRPACRPPQLHFAAVPQFPPSAPPSRPGDEGKRDVYARQRR